MRRYVVPRLAFALVGAAAYASAHRRRGRAVPGTSSGGVFAAVGGLAALVTGISVFVRAVRGWHRLLAIPIVFVVGYVTVLPLATAVYASNVPRPSLGTVTAADRGLRYLDATFATSDGDTRSGWYIPSTNRAALVLLHGASSTRSSVLDEAVVLAHHGSGIPPFDARGHGCSGGRAMDFGWYGDNDIAAAVGYLKRRPDVDHQRVGAIGMSMGGEEAIGALATDPRIKATVAEGATNRVFVAVACRRDVDGDEALHAAASTATTMNVVTPRRDETTCVPSHPAMSGAFSRPQGRAGLSSIWMSACFKRGPEVCSWTWTAPSHPARKTKDVTAAEAVVSHAMTVPRSGSGSTAHSSDDIRPSVKVSAP